MSTDDITAFPAGYTAIEHQGRKCVWVASSYNHPPHNGGVSHMILYDLPSLIARKFIKRDDDGNVVWDAAAMTVEYGVYRPVADTELPDTISSMSRHHTHFNTETNKWELPDITDRVAAGIEQRHDSDVSTAVQNNAQWQVLETLVKARYPGRTGADKAAKDDFYGKWNTTGEADACILQAHAWRKSLGKVEQPENTDALAQTAIENAQMFCMEVMKRGVPRVLYTNKFIANLEADAGKSRGRNYPRGVIIVKELSTPANRLERTVVSIVDGIRTQLSEG